MLLFSVHHAATWSTVSLQKNEWFLVLSAVGAALFQLAFIIPQLTTPLVTYFEQQGVDRFGDTGGKGATAKQVWACGTIWVSML